MKRLGSIAWWTMAFLIICVGAAAAQGTSKPTVPVTEISADLGSCVVEFNVTNMLGKPIYDAKIKTVIRYGFLNKRKLSLEAGTNSDGRARFVKMPNEVKNPLEFEASYGGDTATITWDPGDNCEAEYPILLGKKPEKE
jgi:hypothetical protein